MPEYIVAGVLLKPMPCESAPHDPMTRSSTEAEGIIYEMIFIVVKFTIRPERSEEWLTLTADFTEATRGEPGNISFEWFTSPADPHQFVLMEAFRSREAGEEHVNSDHFKAAMTWMPEMIAETPKIVNVEVPDEEWSEMAELQPRQSH